MGRPPGLARDLEQVVKLLAARFASKVCRRSHAQYSNPRRLPSPPPSGLALLCALPIDCTHAH
eukprot:4621594-Prymnesium_polylepis.1